MRIKINKNNNSFSNSDKPSRFLVELKSEIEELEEKEEQENKKKDRKGYLSFFSKILPILNKLFKPKTRVFAISENQKKSLKSVAFYPILKIVFKFSKIFTWAVHFVLRFFYFSTKAILSKLKGNLFSGNKKTEKKEKRVISWGESAHIPGDKILGNVVKKGPERKRFSFKNILSSLFRKTPKPVFSANYFKKVFYFSLVLLIFSLPLKFFDSYKDLDILSVKGMVLGASEDAVSNLKSASQSASELDFTGAQNGFVRASDDLLAIKIELEKINNGLFFLASLVPNQKIKLASEGKNIIEAGILGTEIGDNFSMAIGAFSEEQSLMDSIRQFNLNIGLARENVLQLNGILEKIDIDLLPDEHKDKIILVRESLVKAEPALLEIYDLSEKLITFLGGDLDKRYLFVFQNNSELRASGGFIGSYALVDFSNGEIKNMEVPGGGSYDTEAGLKEFIIAPEPLHLVNPLWHFWDANWWPDFKKTAQKLMWFYERSGGPSVDGVISLTPTVVEDILGVIGPIDMSSDYGIIIDGENFWIETQSLAEQKPDLTKKPKKIIGDLMNKIFEELPERLNKDNLFDFSKALLKTLNEKQILFYFEDEELQNKAREYSWSGEVEDAVSDYLMVVNTNIAGGKSDRVIEQKIMHNVEISDDGEIYDTVTVERRHAGVKGDLFTGVRNNSWMRFYVPLGSELIKARGFWPIDEELFGEPEDTWKIDEDLIAEREAYVDTDSWTKVYVDSGKTVFANWAWVNPGETVIVSIKYKLPFKINFEEEIEKGFFEKLVESFNGSKNKLAPYSLMVQKQSGTNNDIISSSLNIEGKQKIVWSYGVDDNLVDRGWNMRGVLNRDKYWAVLLEE
ncbi:MAG: DUF4012 domain-containing protein [Patescibacteria group bacterium]|jgi:hypothetical protein|nr:DUF4012 domain-containing protein [Patescibacteria group bacterium]